MVKNETPGEETPAGETPEPTILDAISAALEPTIPKPDETPPDGESTEGEEAGEGEDDEGEAAEEEAGEGTEASARNPDGTFKAKPKGETPDGTAKPGEQKLGPDGKPLAADPKAAKAADPVNDPIPDEVKGRTRARMESLITSVKEKDEMIAVQNQLFDSIKSTGASPEEFGAMLGYMRWIHSEKPEDLRQARDLLLSELEGLSLKLGEAAPGVDLLPRFPDLQEKVNNGQITIADAQEMALHRQRVKVQTDQRTAQQTQEQQSQAATAERSAAIAKLNTLGQTLSESDPLYAQKHEILKPALQALGMLPPSKWEEAFLAAYKAVKLPAAAAASPSGQGAGAKPGQQPLRANKSPSGSSNRQPTSMLDAISAAVDAAG